MKTIEESLDEFSKQKGFRSIESAWYNLSRNEFLELMKDFMQEHAKQVAEAQRELDIKNATANYNAEVDEDSIRNHPLVTDNI